MLRPYRRHGKQKSVEPIAPRLVCLGRTVDLLGLVVLVRVATGGHAAKIKVAVKVKRAMPIRISRRVELPSRRSGARRMFGRDGAVGFHR